MKDPIDLVDIDLLYNKLKKVMISIRVTVASLPRVVTCKDFMTRAGDLIGINAVSVDDAMPDFLWRISRIFWA